MSGLRRSRPDKQDASIRKFQEISVARHGSDSDSAANPQTTSRELRSNDLHKDQNIAPSEFQPSSSHGQQEEQYFFPAYLKVSDLPSSLAVQNFEQSLNLDVGLVGQLSPASANSEQNVVLDARANSHQAKVSTNHGHRLPVIQTPIGSGVSIDNKYVLPSPPVSPRDLSTSPKYGRDIGVRRVEHGRALSSPSSPSLMLKHFKLLAPSGFDSSKRRGSEPVLDSTGDSILKKAQLGVTDRRWEKLRSILVAMKDEPVNIDSDIDPGSPDLQRLQEKISVQEELTSLKREITDLNVILRQKESDLVQLETERNSALAYIRNMKSIGPIDGNVVITSDQLHEQALTRLKEDTVTKDEVVEVATHLVKETLSQRAYLEQLLAVVLTHAPWVLDHMDGVNIARSSKDLEEEEDCLSAYNESDDEVWC